MTTPTLARTRRAGQTNERVALARYTVGAGERVIHGQRVLGVVRLIDDPARGEGRHYDIVIHWRTAPCGGTRPSSRTRRWRSLGAVAAIGVDWVPNPISGPN